MNLHQHAENHTKNKMTCIFHQSQTFVKKHFFNPYLTQYAIFVRPNTMFPTYLESVYIIASKSGSSPMLLCE